MKLTTVAKYLHSQGRQFPRPDAEGKITMAAFDDAGIPMVVACTACEMTMTCHSKRKVDAETGAVFCDSCAESISRPDDSLSRAASEIVRFAQLADKGRENDKGFDAGEFSGPAIDRLESREQRYTAERFGFPSAEALWKAIEERTSERWVHYNFPSLIVWDQDSRAFARH